MKNMDLREKMAFAGLKQYEVAKYMGIHKESLSRILGRDTVSYLNRQLIIHICDKYGKEI